MTGTHGDPAATLGGWLEARRRQQFVGRVAELDLFSTALDSDDPGLRVLFVHGPGGVGKSTLLDECAAVAHDAGAVVVRVDGRTVGDGAPGTVARRLYELLAARMYAS